MINTKTELQIQIAVYGKAGMERLLNARHPEVDGVVWYVSWQLPKETGEIPESLSSRKDFHVEIYHDTGSSRNRNHLLDMPCEAPVILLGDDDCDYTEDGLRGIIEAFKKHPEADIIMGRYRCKGEYKKRYSDKIFNLKHPPRGWYASTIEVAFRRKIIGDRRFNLMFGISGDPIDSPYKIIIGEDTVLIQQLLSEGKKGICVPVDYCSHDNTTTGQREADTPDYLFSQGAIYTLLRSKTWPVRILAEAHRSALPFIESMRHLIAGARFARKNKIFK